MSSPLRNHRSYIAAMGHRLSGLALVLFLPFHFLLLGTAIDGEASLDSALALTRNPLAKIAEWGLVVLLSMHLMFGVRVLLLEFTTFPDHRTRLPRYVFGGLAVSLVLGIVLIFRLVG